MTQNAFNKPLNAILFASPCFVLVFLFFVTPIMVSFYWAVHLESPFGGYSQFVGLQNFIELFSDDEFITIIMRTLIYMMVSSFLAISLSLILALAVDRGMRGISHVGSVFIWPKAFAAASVSIVFAFLLDSHMGLLSGITQHYPHFWNPRDNTLHAWIMIYIAGVWGNILFNFVVILAGLQAIPSTYHKAGAIDGAGPWRRLWDIQLPLITPQLFVTMLLEINQGLTSSFAIIQNMTEGGPRGETTLIIYKLYLDGFVGLDLSSAAAQTVIVLLLGLAIAGLQFLFLGKHIKYER